MFTTNAREHCLLCGATVDEHQVLQHLRLVHQVTPGERTVTDVPTGKMGKVLVAKAVEHNDLLLLVTR